MITYPQQFEAEISVNPLESVWEFIKEWNGMIIKGMEWNGFSRERNGMEWNLKILFGCYKINEWKGIEWKVNNTVWK